MGCRAPSTAAQARQAGRLPRLAPKSPQRGLAAGPGVAGTSVARSARWPAPAMVRQLQTELGGAPPTSRAGRTRARARADPGANDDGLPRRAPHPSFVVEDARAI